MSAHSKTPDEATSEPLNVHVRSSVENYFVELNGHKPNDLYDLVLSEMEAPLFEVVMKKTAGNLTKAAEILGINRATLRKKLRRYGLAER
ncbi:MAG: DNA-binding transcriptional regulator Fis [Pseudomonadota bacterium]